MTQATMTHLQLAPGEPSGQVANGIGLVAPFDFALDDECRQWLPTGVPLFTTRTPRLEDDAVTVNLAQEVASEVAVAPAVGSLLAVEPKVVAYACTSGSFVAGLEGEQHLRDIMLKAGADQAITTSGALLEALQFLNIKRLSLATPYNQELTALLVDFLQEADVSVTHSGYLGMEQAIARVSPAAVSKMAAEVDRPDAEAIFFSCTNLHTFGIFEQLEQQLGKPVLSANQVTMWAALRAGGFTVPPLRQRLFATSR